MSDALAIASVTKMLLGMLNTIPTKYDLNTLLSSSLVTFSALPPNRIIITESEEPRINLFLYRVAPNPGWSNRNLPSRDSNGQRTGNPLLALDLYYLMSAYGKKDLDADILLGCAAQVLHETPFLTRTSITGYLEDHPLSTSVLDGSRLADQVEQIKISPVQLSTEEISKLWTAFQAPCRSSIAYQVSVVLIESRKPARSNLPVLTRGKPDPETGRDQGVFVSPSLRFPTLTGVCPPDNQPSARIGDTVILTGHDLSGETITVECRHHRQNSVLHPVVVNPPSDTRISFQIPGDPFDTSHVLVWPAGYYSVRVTILKGDRTLVTNTLPVAIAPAAGSVPANPAATRSGNTLTVTLVCSPPVLPSQDASIIIRDRELIADPRKVTTDTLTFRGTIPGQDLPAGSYYYRIRIDGVESQLIDRTQKPPRFLDSQKVDIP